MRIMSEIYNTSQAGSEKIMVQFVQAYLDFPVCVMETVFYKSDDIWFSVTVKVSQTIGYLYVVE